MGGFLFWFGLPLLYHICGVEVFACPVCSPVLPVCLLPPSPIPPSLPTAEKNKIPHPL